MKSKRTNDKQKWFSKKPAQEKEIKKSVIKSEKVTRKKEKKQQGKKTGKIIYRLSGAFLVPVFLIILLGVLSYITASDNISKQYKSSVNGTVATVGDYSTLLCKTIENKTTEIVTNTAFNNYYGRYAGKNDTDAMSAYRDVTTILTTAKGTCNYINSYSVFTKEGGNVTSTSGRLKAEAYDEFAKSDEAAKITGGQGVWSGYHKFIDKQLSMAEDTYALAYTRKLSKGDGYICIDVTYSAIQDMLKSLTTGKGAISAIVSESDGREVIYTDSDDAKKMSEKEHLFVGTTYVKDAAVDAKAGSTYVSVDGKKYLFGYSPVGNTGLMVCTLIPNSTILSAADSIRNVTIIIVLLASVIAIFIGSVIARSISREVKNLTKTMNKVSDGDFTTQFSSKRKDEFQLLTHGMMDMLANIRGILGEMIHFSDKVNNTSKGVSDTAESMADSMNDINVAMEEVANGVSRQADDTEHSLTLMAEFSEKLNEVYEHTNHMEQSSESAMQAVKTGKEQIAELNQKSEAATEMTKQLVADIADVNENSNNIGSIIEAIQAIAQQTNLLSLNASIEAARAGEAGRGFAVVAEEIRNLADQSAQAGNQIQKMIENIQMTTEKTSDCAKKTEGYLQEQSDSIQGTIEAFGLIADDVEQMVTVLHKITANMANMVTDKDEVLDSIRSIASVSEEAAASTEEVTATVNTQLEDAKTLAIEAERLSKEVQQLSASMQKFKV